MDKNTSAWAKPNQMAAQGKWVGMVSAVVKTKDVKQEEQLSKGREAGNSWATAIGNAHL